MQKLIENVTCKIEQGELLEALSEIAAVWKQQNPQEELVFVTLPREDLDERKRLIELVLAMESR